jgi:SSS family solute:Na+ symporter
MDLEQWTVGGRSFGTIFVFLLMAGEAYTTFTFLGGSGFAYGKGAPVYYILAYGTLAYVLSYWMLPPVWRYAKQHRLVSQPHFFAQKYQSPLLGVIVALVGVAALVPYLVLQLKGLGIIVSSASYGVISSSTAVWIGAATLAAYVTVSGVRGSAWNSILKDISILVVVLFLGIYLPFHYYGGIGEMFRAINTAKPGFLTFASRGTSVVWFESTVMLSVFGFFMWPHVFGSIFTAKSDVVFRKNAIILPIYQLILLFVFFVGFAAVLQIPGLKGADSDLALLRLSLLSFDPWFVGVIGAAGVLTALVPGSMIVISATTLIANDVYRGGINRSASNDAVAKLAKILVPILVLIAVGLALSGGNTIVSLLLMGYSFVTQLFPAFICSLAKENPVSKQGAIAGIVVGVAIVVMTNVWKLTTAVLFPFLPSALQDINTGLLAFVLNFSTMAIVSLLTRRSESIHTKAT